jgi:hypothetical protein
MGVLCDYFRAPDASVAATVVDLPAGPIAPGDDGRTHFDGVDAKGVMPHVMLGQLVAIVRGVPYDDEILTTATVWPPPDTAPASVEEYEDLPEDSPWHTGPWVEELDDGTRDTLADIDADRVGEYAARWAEIEEFSFAGVPPGDDLRPLVVELSSLAGRARDAGERLYCWSSL